MCIINKSITLITGVLVHRIRTHRSPLPRQRSRPSRHPQRHLELALRPSCRGGRAGVLRPRAAGCGRRVDHFWWIHLPPPLHSLTNIPDHTGHPYLSLYLYESGSPFEEVVNRYMITGLGINAFNPRGIGVEGVVVNANASGAVGDFVVAATKGIGAVASAVVGIQ